MIYNVEGLFLGDKFYKTGPWYSWCVRLTENQKDQVRFLKVPPDAPIFIDFVTHLKNYYYINLKNSSLF